VTGLIASTPTKRAAGRTATRGFSEHAADVSTALFNQRLWKHESVAVNRWRGRASVGRNFPPCCLGATFVSEMPFENGQIVGRDSVDAKTVEVMSYAASFPDSLFGDALNPSTLNQELQTSQ
jgi:hypothetical protein